MGRERRRRRRFYYDDIGHVFGDVCVRFDLVCLPPNRVDEMVQRLVRYRGQADNYDGTVVSVRGMLENVQFKHDGLRNKLAEAREEMAQAVRIEGEAREGETEAFAVRYNAQSKLTQVRNCLTRF